MRTKLTKILFKFETKTNQEKKKRKKNMKRT